MANQNSAYRPWRFSLLHKKIIKLIIITINNQIWIWDKKILSILLKHRVTSFCNKIKRLMMITAHCILLTQKYKCFLLQENLTLQEPKEINKWLIHILKQCHSKITFNHLKVAQQQRRQIQDPILKNFLQRSLQKVLSVPPQREQLFSLNLVYRMSLQIISSCITKSMEFNSNNVILLILSLLYSSHNKRSLLNSSSSSSRWEVVVKE